MDSPTSVVPRACQNCSMRKVRCNRRMPCSSCTSSDLICPGIPKKRIRRSTKSESSNNHGARQRRGGTEASEQLADNASSVQRKLNGIDMHTKAKQGENDLLSLEGASTFRRQAIIACEVAECGMLSGASSPDLVTELSSLRTALEGEEIRQAEGPTETRASGSGRKSTPRSDALPSEFVLSLLRWLRTQEEEQILLTLFYPIEDLNYLQELCQKVYFPVYPVSRGEIALLNGLLLFVLDDLRAFPQSDFSTEEVEAHRLVCREQFLEGLENHEVKLIPTYEHTLLLCIAALNAQTDGDVVRQWRAASNAARHCLALGYHLEDVVSKLQPSVSSKVRRLFWYVYFVDKSPVLTLGRASVIQDYDMDTQALSISEDPQRKPWDMAFQLFVERSTIHAYIYEALYSPAARKLDCSARQANVNTISNQLHHWRGKWQEIDSTNAHRQDIFQHTFAPVDISYYSALTILYRAVDISTLPSDKTSASIESARKALEANELACSQTRLSGPGFSAFHSIWAHLYLPFSPFITTFMHYLVYPNPEDLRLLKASLDILREASSAIEQCKRLYSICGHLYRVAELQVSSQGRVGKDDITASNQAVELFLEHSFDGTWAARNDGIDGVPSAHYLDEWNEFEFP